MAVNPQMHEGLRNFQRDGCRLSAPSIDPAALRYYLDEEVDGCTPWIIPGNPR